MNVEAFSDFGLKEELLASLNDNEFLVPTRIQVEAIPTILEGRDVLAQAKTGSGKTGAFVIPIIHRLMNDPVAFETKAYLARYVVLSPTRELAQQTFNVVNIFGQKLGIKGVCVIGGESAMAQKSVLENGIHIIIGTPGRIVDLYKQKMIRLEECRGVVLDEADRLFDMGFKDDIRYILNKAPLDRQLLMFSATNNLDVLNTAYQFKSHPVEIKAGSGELLVNEINQSLIHVGDNEKMPLLVGILKRTPEVYGMIFCNTQSETHVVAEWLQRLDLGLDIKAISGKLPQEKRTKLIADFRSRKINLLVCTDVAARGLDVEDVNLVVNYDLPQEAANYVHRIGRTGRAGKDGRAISFCGYVDCEFLGPIEKYLKSKIPTEQIDEGMLERGIGPRPSMKRMMDEMDKKFDERKDENRYGDSRRRDNRRRDGKRDGDSRDGARRNASARDGQERRERNDRGDRQQRGRRDDRNRSTNRPRNERRPGPGEGRQERTREASKPRSLVIESKSFEKAKAQALAGLGINDASLLSHKVLEKGKRPFLGLFGARNIKYNFFVNPNFEILARNFISELFKLSHLELENSMRSEHEQLTIDFLGKDESLLTQNAFEMLESIEHLLRKHLAKVAGLDRNFRLVLTCNGKGNSKESKLQDLAEKMKQKVLTTQKPVTLSSMAPGERRIVHQQLHDDPQVETKSVGDGHYKRIIISPR